MAPYFAFHGGGGHGEGSSQNAFKHNIVGGQTCLRTRPCRVIIAVDVSGSMTNHIDSVMNGILQVNSVLINEDLVSVIDFAEKQKTIFPYMERYWVNWDLLWCTLQNDVQSASRGSRTALWDAIGYTLDTTPRDSSYEEYKPELIIFTDGQDNFSSNFNSESIQWKLQRPGIRHAHITIIDASRWGNNTLQHICDPIGHCSYLRVEASPQAIDRAFTQVVADVMSRLGPR